MRQKKIKSMVLNIYFKFWNGKISAKQGYFYYIYPQNNGNLNL